ncbi:MAG: hypothetical protein EON58_03480 [Alphaproteobacteria bacterium]|nr:MAG: hypothetical protein EON58_03480 [Alphaproteobacteria bacterium]
MNFGIFKIDVKGIIATNVISMALPTLSLIFETQESSKIYVIPFGICAAALFVGLAFIPRLSEGYMHALSALIFSIVCEALIISVLVYFSGLRVGMLNSEEGSALKTVAVSSIIYAGLLVFVYTVDQLGPRKRL